MDHLDYTPPKSGDLCHLVGDGLVEHYRCDQHADGTVVNARTGQIVTPAPEGALRGFDRPAVNA